MRLIRKYRNNIFIMCFIILGVLFINNKTLLAKDEMPYSGANIKFVDSVTGCTGYFKGGASCTPTINYFKESIANTGEPYKPSLTSASGTKTTCPSSGSSKSASKAFTIYKQGSSTAMTFLMTVEWEISCDTTKPTLTAVADNACYAVGQSVKRTWTCKDSGSGCVKSPYEVWSTGATASVTAEDKVGNSKTSSSVSINRDGTGPSKTIGVISTSACTTSLNLWGRCLADSGCAGCGADTYYGQITANGTYYYTAKDNVGNATTGAATITNIDRNPPECGDIVYPNNSYYYKSSFNVGAKCVNDSSCSGCSKSTFTETKSSASGSITIKDGLGNSRTCSYSGVKIDKTAPSVTVSYGTGFTQNTSTMQASETVPVVISATDSGGAGVDKVCYKLSGATTKDSTCVSGSSTTVNVSKEGTTTVTAWAYDKARDYDASTNGPASGNGNKSSEKTLKVYVDKTAPTITISSNNDGKTWDNTSSPVTIKLEDSGSGLGAYRYYWSTTNSDTYDESTALSRTSTTKVVTGTYESAHNTSKTFTENHPTNAAHNDVIYLHVKACDRSFNTPNCATKTYKVGIHFDNMAPAVATANPSSIEWVNKFELTLDASETVQTGKQNSGLNTIYTYWDNNTNHVESGKTTANSSFVTNATLTNARPGSSYTTAYSWTMNFANLKNVLKDGTENSIGAAEEGTRFLKVTVSDIAGNVSQALLTGPYKWDTTKPETEILDIVGNDRTFLSAENQ